MWVCQPVPQENLSVTPRTKMQAQQSEKQLQGEAFSDGACDGKQTQAVQSAAAVSAPAGRAILPRRQAFITPKIQAGLVICVLLYCVGLLASGCVLAFSNGQASRFLQYYTQNWIALFGKDVQPLHLFSTLFLSGMLSMSLILLFGLSAFGAPLIGALLVAKGVGSGLLSLELFFEHGWRGILLYIACPAISDVFLAWCLCSAGVIGAKFSKSLLKKCKNNPDVEHSHIGIGMLVNRYLFLCTLQILSCGISAVLSPWVMPLILG